MKVTIWVLSILFFNFLILEIDIVVFVYIQRQTKGNSNCMCLGSNEAALCFIPTEKRSELLKLAGVGFPFFSKAKQNFKV